MQMIHMTCLLLFLLASHRTLADDESSTETNEIIPREAIQKLDFSVRQALLRAIDKLEKEGEEHTNKNDDADNATENTTVPVTADTKEEILEESTSRSDIFPSVQFFTATYDENNAQEQPLALFIDKTKKKTHNNLASPVLVTTSVKEELKGNNQAGYSVKNNDQANEISLNSLDEIKFEIRNSKAKLATTTEAYTTTTTLRPKTTKKRTTTTSTTTTTTTPRPTHNEDGENIEVVSKDDIRILAAPLVSAFTVDLDESGAAKNVIPIIDSPASTTATVLSSTQKTSSIFQPPPFGPTITRLNVLPSDTQRTAALNSVNNLPPAPTHATYGPSTVNSIYSNIAPTSGHYITKQPLPTNFNTKQPQQQQQSSNVNSYLIEKQRELEQQIYQLKLQAQQQQELILRQLKLLEEQAKLTGTSSSTNNNPINANNSPQNQVSHNFLQTHTGQQSQQLQHLSSAQQQQQQEPAFTIRPSVEFIPSSQSKIPPIYPTISLEQQLPLKGPNGKYINGGHQQPQHNNRFANNGVQTQNQQQPQQRFPIDTNPIQHVFHKLQNLQNLFKSNTQAASSISSVQIQPSNQLNIAPTYASLLPQAPAELSLVQALPQRNYQQFQQSNQNFVPQYVTDALLEQQQQKQQQNRARLFRQEGDTANFGINQVQIQPNNNNIFSSNNPQQQQSTNSFDNQNFYRQHLTPTFSNQLQQNAQTFYQQHQQQQTQQNSPTALNHGINNFAQQTLLPPAQSSSAPTGTQSLAQSSAHYNSNIF